MQMKQRTENWIVTYLRLRNPIKLSSAMYLQKNQIFITLVMISIRCNELAEPIAASCTMAHNAKLHRRRVDDN